MSDVGRNAPCPCGSGKKYKKCCMGMCEAAVQQGALGDVFAELHNAIEGRTFSSMEELQAVTDGFMEKQNQASDDGFHGLSSKQMHRMLYFQFESPELFAFADNFETIPDAPLLSLFGLLKDAIGEKGLEPTEDGNLPINFCREAARSYLGDAEYEEMTQEYVINSEVDFEEMHITRLVAECAGLVQKFKGKFILSSKCRDILAQKGLGGIYPVLFHAYVTKFNWSYLEGLEEIPFIQQSFLFTLFMLRKFGDTPRPNRFYEELFLNAFPAVLNDVPGDQYSTPEQQTRLCYCLRSLERFVGFMGLANVEQVHSDDPWDRGYILSSQLLLDEVVQFNI